MGHVKPADQLGQFRCEPQKVSIAKPADVQALMRAVADDPDLTRRNHAERSTQERDGKAGIDQGNARGTFEQKTTRRKDVDHPQGQTPHVGSFASGSQIAEKCTVRVEDLHRTLLTAGA